MMLKYTECNTCPKIIEQAIKRIVIEPCGTSIEYNICSSCNGATDSALMLADEGKWPDCNSGWRPYLHPADSLHDYKEYQECKRINHTTESES